MTRKKIGTKLSQGLSGRRTIIIAVSLIVLFVIVFLAIMAMNIRAPEGLVPAGTLFSISRGETGHHVAARLEQEGLIRSSLFFRILGKLKGVEDSLKAGTYSVEPGMSAAAVMEIFVSGKQALVRVTIPEGYTLSQTASLLDNNGIADAGQFVIACSDQSLIAEFGLKGTSLEGYLFPDTYFFPRDYGPQAVLRAMIKAFRLRLATIPEASLLSPQELSDRVVLASIIEREYRIAEEASVMASVFFNRLRVGMALQSCATVVYVITEKLHKPHPEILFDKDIRIADSFNTYIYPGLPPGPISSPGMTALRAVFYPASTRYLYFRLIDPDTGRHHFSPTLEEHVGARSFLVKRVGG